MEASKKIFYSKKSEIFPNITGKKNSSTAPPSDKIVKPWWMIVNTFLYNTSRNKKFSKHTPWDKFFLLSQNTKFSTKKFLLPFHLQLKLWNLGRWWLICPPNMPPRIKFLSCTGSSLEFFYSPKIKNCLKFSLETPIFP